MKLTVLSATPCDDPCMLAPAPNVTESAEIAALAAQDATEPVTDPVGVELDLLYSYRGHLLYYTGGVSVHRYAPSTPGVNGRVSLPSDGVRETVVLRTNSGCFHAEVAFA